MFVKVIVPLIGVAFVLPDKTIPGTVSVNVSFLVYD